MSISRSRGSRHANYLTWPIYQYEQADEDTTSMWKLLEGWKPGKQADGKERCRQSVISQASAFLSPSSAQVAAAHTFDASCSR